MEFIKITKDGKVNQVINPKAIVSVERTFDDPHGNKYTEIVLSSNGVIKVAETFESVIEILETQDYENPLTAYDYKFEFSIK
ncbi:MULTISPECIES: hypothetical protein [unclassified Sphingobacterium]|uniref:hypothetical protein n=1 Tax=unclassified Sphingobacterium TaxID=2609468 RepID=UPI0020C44EA4|nr:MULTISPECIES: hypothetical protein [unclassified Sphingobacterium]